MWFAVASAHTGRRLRFGAVVHVPQRVANRAISKISAPSKAQPSNLLGFATDEKFNIPVSVQQKLGRHLINKTNHPLGIVWGAVQAYMSSQEGPCRFFDQEVPVVGTQQCFDDLLVHPEHPSRSPSDTYFVNSDMVLRTHTSAHQVQHMRLYPQVSAFLCAGDVFRRDEIDSSHYPIFHQCEGVRLFETAKLSAKDVEADLKRTLEGLAGHLFGITPGSQMMRWNDDYFPFTEPSFELEIFHNDSWIEVLGCGVIHREVLRNADLDPSEVHGWAFGLGLDRLAMVLFNIPDIRLFWSEDIRFLEQFDEDSFAKRIQFRPFSKYPPVSKDISAWLPADFVENDLFEMIRDEGGDQVERVEVVDAFTHPKTKRSSKLFRVTWRDMSRTLTHAEVNDMHSKVLERVVDELRLELR